MIKDELKDSKTDIIGIEEKFRSVFLKGERIAIALYKVTDFLPEDEPLRAQMRDVILDMLKALQLRNMSDARHAANHCATLSNLVLETGTGSLMNYHILKGELENFAEAMNHLDSHSNLRVYLKSDISPLSESSPLEADLFKGQKDIKGQYKKTVLVQGNVSEIGGRKSLILNFLRKNTNSNIKDISTLFPGISEKTVQRDLVQLIAEGTVIKSGKRRWSRYSLGVKDGAPAH